MINWMLLNQVASVTSNGEKAFENFGKEGISGVGAYLNSVSATLTSASMLLNYLEMAPSIGLSLASLQTNKLNLAVQTAALSQAFSSNNSQGIACGFVGVLGATASIVGSIPGLPPTITAPARALGLGCGALSMLLNDPNN